MYLNATGGGDVDGSDGQTYSSKVGAFTPNTWNTVAIQFNNSLGNVFQVSVNGGPYSGNLASGGSMANIDEISLYDENTEAHDFWIDNINITGSGTGGGSGSGGTPGQLAKFLTPTTFGNALLSDDGTNTTLTSGNFYIQVGALIDTIASGILNFGTTNATTLNFGSSGTNSIFNGNVGIGTSTPGSLFSLGGIANFTTATTSFYGKGINLSGGCFAVNGVCIGSNGIASTSGVSSIQQTYGGAQTGALTFATSSIFSNGLINGLSVSNSGSTFTFLPTFKTMPANRILYSDITGNNILFAATSSLNIGGTAANVTGTVAVANGGTGTTTLRGILFGNGTSSVSSLTIGNGISLTGSTLSVATSSNCNSSASPAVCGSSPSGSVAMATGGSTLVVDTTAVTANSQIFVTEDSSLGTRLGITCNTTTGRTYTISARTAGTSFTIKSSANPATNKACLSYWIVN